MAKMYNPPHPAAIRREDVLPALGLTVTEAARQLGVSRVWPCRACSMSGPVSPSIWRGGRWAPAQISQRVIVAVAQWRARRGSRERIAGGVGEG